MAKRGRKGKYEEWQTPEKLLMLEAWARDGVTDENIAKNIGINVKTLYEWKNKYSNICNALKKGKEFVDVAVENALLKKALGGDLGAICFWLKNRKPKTWRDKPVEEQNTQAFNEGMVALAQLLQNPQPKRKLNLGEDDDV